MTRDQLIVSLNIFDAGLEGLSGSTWRLPEGQLPLTVFAGPQVKASGIVLVEIFASVDLLMVNDGTLSTVMALSQVYAITTTPTDD